MVDSLSTYRNFDYQSLNNSLNFSPPSLFWHLCVIISSYVGQIYSPEWKCPSRTTGILDACSVVRPWTGWINTLQRMQMYQEQQRRDNGQLKKLKQHNGNDVKEILAKHAPKIPGIDSVEVDHHASDGGRTISYLYR